MEMTAEAQSRKSLIMGNWKSNGRMEHIDHFANEVVKDIEFDT
jgi:hypothetical protein